MLLSTFFLNSQNGCPTHGNFTAAAEAFGCDKSTISRYWKQWLDTATLENLSGNLDSSMKGKKGKKLYNDQELILRIKSLPFKYRQTIRDIASRVGVSTWKVQNLKSMGLLKRHNTRLKPVLTLKNMHDRISHVMKYIDVTTMKFDPMLNIVHIEEMWFNQDRDKRSYYLLDDEEEPTDNVIGGPNDLSTVGFMELRTWGVLI
jgi:hypothetical protein